jgi:hypothetical protein
VEGVGAELDAGADLAELRRAFEHGDVEAFLREAECGGEAADATAGDDDGLVVHGCVSFLGFSRCRGWSVEGWT